MTTTIAVETTDKIAKLVRVIFSSDRPGEVAAAVDATKRLLTTNGLDCHWVADRIAAPVARPDASGRYRDDDDDDGQDDRSRIFFCWHRRRFLSPRERDFIERIRDWRGPISEKQRRWLHNICDHLEAG
jgi:hypothetical protein